MGGFGFAVAVAGLLVVFAKDLRAGWFIAFFTLSLSAYVSLVFQRRHVFHLEFISWWLAGFLAQAALVTSRAIVNGAAFVDARARLLRPTLQAAACLLLITVSGVAVLSAARGYQQREMLQLVEHYDGMPVDERRVSRGAHESGGVIVRIAGISLSERKSLSDADQTADFLVVRFACREARPIVV